MATSCPPVAKNHEAENMLKTKGRKRAFSKNEAENILKKSHLQKTVGIRKEHDKMSAEGTPQAGLTVGGNGKLS